MQAVITLFWNLEVEEFHVFVNHSHYTFDALLNFLNDHVVHNTKLLSDIRIISINKLLDKIFHSCMLISASIY
jgi:hypothetical protein